MALVMHFFDEVLLVPAGRCVWSMYFSLFNLLVLCTHRFLFFLHWLQIRFGPVVLEFAASPSSYVFATSTSVAEHHHGLLLPYVMNSMEQRVATDTALPGGRALRRYTEIKSESDLFFSLLKSRQRDTKHTTSTRRQKETTHHRFMMKWMSFSLVLHTFCENGLGIWLITPLDGIF